MSVLTEIIPDFYSNFISNDLKFIDVTEKKATCHSCLRSRDNRFAYTYRSNLKCCTFHPFLTNYSVGGILTDYNQTSGALSIKNKILKNEFVLPIGITAPFDYQFKFLNKEESDFGNRDDLLCPYYDKLAQGCSIWKYRGCVCTTFFCRSDYGQSGMKFWSVLNDYLSYLEIGLAEECLVQLDFSPRDISDQLFFLNKREFNSDETNKNRLNQNEIKRMWNGYADLEDFYKKCFQIVKSISRKQFKEIIGEQGLYLEKEVLEYASFRKSRTN
jgi:hypothetical protein